VWIFALCFVLFAEKYKYKSKFKMKSNKNNFPLLERNIKKPLDKHIRLSYNGVNDNTTLEGKVHQNGKGKHDKKGSCIFGWG
jgi:hypothetical protein